MNLQELKNSVNIIEIARELGLQLDTKGKCLCPFHKEKTPSLQFSEKKQIATCFGGSCDAGTMDVIGLVQKFYSWELPQAIEWLKSHANFSANKADTQYPLPSNPNYGAIFQSLQPKLGKSSKARAYLQNRHLDYKELEAGFNTGKEYEQLKYCIVFPLKNKKGAVVSLYGRSIYDNSKCKNYYTINRKGLYPSYPNAATKTLIITESIIDTVTLVHHFPYSKATAVLAAYGTNGLTKEHIKAIKELQHLEEIVLWFDGDAAGKIAAQNYAAQLGVLGIKISTVEMLEGEDINSLLDSHATEIFTHLYEKRNTIQHIEKPKIKGVPVQLTPSKPKLHISPNYAVYTDKYVKIELMGKVDIKDLSKLKVTAIIYNAQILERPPSRNNVDLYNDDGVEKLTRKVATKIEVGSSAIREALNTITKDLEVYRLEQQDKKPQLAKERYALRTISQAEETQAKAVLEDANLHAILLQKLGATGIIGESKNALFLLIILISRKTDTPLNAMVQGTSGSGKSHLIKKVADCMYNQNKVKRFTRVTDKSFYNYAETDLMHCAIILEDYDGLTEEAELAWRELQSNGKLTSSVSQKNEQTGEISTGEKYVFGPIASIVATTNFRIYEDNESRVFVIAIDESEAQTERVLDYMAKKASKEITSNQETIVRQELQNMVYLLQPYGVKNTYRLELPKTTKQRRRLTQMLHDYIEQVTLLHQYQRRKENKLLITEIIDVEIAVDLMFNSIVLKTDELDGILRQFYEDLKTYVEKKGRSYEFTQREIRQHFRISKTQMFRYVKELEELEYIHKSGIGARNMYKFKIAYWDNIEKLRSSIKVHLQEQITNYKSRER